MSSILVVDDHADIRRLLSVTLGKGHDILEADNGAQALDIIERALPRVVLLDVMMPGDVSGMDVLKAIRNNPALRSTRVAMLTARGQSSDMDAATELGADAYFVKPFSPLKVLHWVQGNL